MIFFIVSFCWDLHDDVIKKKYCSYTNIFESCRSHFFGLVFATEKGIGFGLTVLSDRDCFQTTYV